MTADSVVRNARVRTLDAPGTVCEAFATRDGRVIATGTTAEIDALRSPSTTVIDAAGATVLPAFTDSHTHLRRAAHANAYFIDFTTAAPGTIREVLALVARAAADAAPGEWVRGDNLVPEAIAEHRFPDRSELDEVGAGHPVILRGIGSHVVAVNSVALGLSGIDRATSDPTGGRIERDAAGEPTGILHERAKLRLDETRTDTVIPPIGREQRITALARSMAMLHANGIAAIHEIVRDPDDFGDYLLLRSRGGLGVRVRFYVRGLDATTSLDQVTGIGLRSEFGDDWLRLGGIKFSIDGLETAGNAAVYRPYHDDRDNTGVLRIPPDDLRQAIHTADAAGLQVAVHAIGPRAVDMALDCFESLPRHDEPLMHRLEHAYLPAPPGQWQRIADLGLLWSTQPGFLTRFGDAWVDLLDTEPTDGAWLPLRTARELGVRTQLNSDYPCATINPFEIAHAAVTRTTASGERIPGDETITVDQALRAMTNTAAADSTGDAGNRGSIEVGKLADFVVVSDDPYEVAPANLAKIAVLRTAIAGELVYDAIPR
jgi:hypothetical protein